MKHILIIGAGKSSSALIRYLFDKILKKQETIASLLVNEEITFKLSI